MAAIKNNKEYDVICSRMEELLELIDDKVPMSEKDTIELALLSDLVADYEDVNIEIVKPSLIEEIRYYMNENKLTQKQLAEILNVSSSRVNDYLNGNSEPTLKIGRLLNQRLGIDAEIILGV